MSGGSDIDDSVTSTFSTTKQDAQKLLTLPGRMMLDEMLKQLGFPLAHYQRTIYEDHKVSVTITFQTSKLTCEGSLVPMTITGVRSMDGPLAEHTAAVAAMRYMENAANTEIRDLNYSRLKQLEKENKYLKSELNKAKFKSTILGRGWFLSLRYMHSFAAQFHNMAILGYFGGQEIIKDDMKAPLLNINGTTQMLKERSDLLHTKLERVRRST